jgi:hypothetical protein
MRRIGIALAVGAALVAVAGIIALVTGGDRFFQACAVVGVVCVGATAVMSGVLFAGGNYPSRAAMTQMPAAAGDADTDDPVDSETRSRLNSVYPLLAGLPCIVMAAVHYL